jgi:transcriptional regulator with XRE-family HTH domain
VGRSHRASITGLAAANKAFKLKGRTQDYLAGAAGCSRQTVSNFFVRRPVDKQLFQAICTELGLEWGDIVELDEAERPDNSLSLDKFVQSVRDNLYGSIIEKCGFMRVLDMSQPLGLDDIYTTVNILEKITGRRRLEIAELLKQTLRILSDLA